MKLKTTKNRLEKCILLERVKILKEHIIDNPKESRTTTISKAAESVKNKVDNGGKIWQVKRKQNQHQILKKQR